MWQKTKILWSKTYGYFVTHKSIGVIVAVVVLGGGYYVYGHFSATTTAPSYVLTTAAKDSVIVTVAGTGQVSSSGQLDITPQVSGKIIDIKVKAGQTVKAGAALAQIATKDLNVTLQNAKNSLNSAQASLNLKLAGVTPEEITVAQKSVESAKLAYDNSIVTLDNTQRSAAESLKQAQLKLDNSAISLAKAQKAYDDALKNQDITGDSDNQSLVAAYNSEKNAINSSLVTLRSAMNAGYTVVFSGYDELGVMNKQTYYDARDSWNAANNDLMTLESKYNSAGSSWSQALTDELATATQKSLLSMKTFEHNTYTMLLNSLSSPDFSQSTLDSYKSSISSQESAVLSSTSSLQTTMQNVASTKLDLESSGISTTGTVSTAEAALQSAQNDYATSQSSLEQTKLSNEKSIASATMDVASKKISYETAQAQYELKIAKPRPVDIASLQIQVAQAVTTYNQALDNFKAATIIAPYDGVIARIDQNVGDMAGTSTVFSTIITPQQFAVITLNEVDIAKVKFGQKVNVSLSAIDGLELTGEVAEIDALGTVTQGVVTYNVKIAFDTEDERIKPQMSVSASIIVDSKIDVLTVPNSTVKSDSTGSCVEILTDAVLESDGKATSQKGPEKKYVQTGLSDDSLTEIISGIGEGDQVVSRTVTSSATPTTTTSSGGGGFGILGGR